MLKICEYLVIKRVHLHFILEVVIQQHQFLKIAALEGTEKAIALGSGMAAISTAILSQIKIEHMISVKRPYAGTDRFMKEICHH